VGHGNAAFVHEGDSTVLIDAAAGSHVLEYLTQSGISDISKVLLSHSDYDHIGGLIALLNNGITIRSIVVNGDASKKSEAWRDLVFSLEDARRRGDVEFTVGMSSGYINVPGFVRCEVEVVAPIPEIAALGVGATDRLGRRITSNSISAGVRISVDGRPIVLLSGDMDEISLDGSLQGGADLMADILVFPHHGGHSGGQDVKAFAAKFLSAVTPTHVLFSHGRNKHENPREEAIVASVEAGAVVACTQPSKRCSDDIASTDEHLDRCYSAGRGSSNCCAGTFVIEFDGKIFAHRRSAEHQFFIENHVGNAMCRRKPI